MKLTLLLTPLVVLALIGMLYSGVIGDGSKEHVVTGDLVALAAEAKGGLAARFEKVNRQYATVNLTEPELRDLVLTSLAQHPGGVKLLELSNGFGARIVEGQIELRLFLNVAKMKEGLSKEELDLFERAVSTSRLAENRDVDVKVQGAPSTVNGVLRVQPADATLKLAVLSLDLRSWTERVGFKRQEVERLLQFKVPGFRVKEASVLEDSLSISIRRI